MKNASKDMPREKERNLQPMLFNLNPKHIFETKKNSGPTHEPEPQENFRQTGGCRVPCNEREEDRSPCALPFVFDFKLWRLCRRLAKIVLELAGLKRQRPKCGAKLPACSEGSSNWHRRGRSWQARRRPPRSHRRPVHKIPPLHLRRGQAKGKPHH